MENKVLFGTYNVPSTDVSLSASYVVSGTPSKEEKAIFIEKASETDPIFDQNLKGLLNVPKPAKTKK